MTDIDVLNKKEDDIEHLRNNNIIKNLIIENFSEQEIINIKSVIADLYNQIIRDNEALIAASNILTNDNTRQSKEMNNFEKIKSDLLNISECCLIFLNKSNIDLKFLINNNGDLKINFLNYFNNFISILEKNDNLNKDIEIEEAKKSYKSLQNVLEFKEIRGIYNSEKDKFFIVKKDCMFFNNDQNNIIIDINNSKYPNESCTINLNEFDLKKSNKEIDENIKDCLEKNYKNFCSKNEIGSFKRLFSESSKNKYKEYFENKDSKLVIIPNNIKTLLQSQKENLENIKNIKNSAKIIIDINKVKKNSLKYLSVVFFDKNDINEQNKQLINSENYKLFKDLEDNKILLFNLKKYEFLKKFKLNLNTKKIITKLY